MKINLDIPDKYEGTNLTLMWGMVPIAKYRINKGYWEIRTADCSRCGRCCELPNTPFPGENGCLYLDKGNGNGAICKLGLFRPVGCSYGGADIEDCSVKWEKM